MTGAVNAPTLASRLYSAEGSGGQSSHGLSGGDASISMMISDHLLAPYQPDMPAGSYSVDGNSYNLPGSYETQNSFNPLTVTDLSFQNDGDGPHAV